MLGAINDEFVAALVGAGGHFGGRAAGVRLGDANRRFVAGQHIVGGQPLLRVAAIGHDGGDTAHIAFDGDASGDTTDLGHFLDHQNGVQPAGALPAPFGWDGHAHEAGLGQGGDIVPRVLFAAVDLGGTRLDHILGQLGGARFQRFLVRRQIELHGVSS